MLSKGEVDWIRKEIFPGGSRKNSKINMKHLFPICLILVDNRNAIHIIGISTSEKKISLFPCELYTKIFLNSNVMIFPIHSDCMSVTVWGGVVAVPTPYGSGRKSFWCLRDLFIMLCFRSSYCEDPYARRHTSDTATTR